MKGKKMIYKDDMVELVENWLEKNNPGEVLADSARAVSESEKYACITFSTLSGEMSIKMMDDPDEDWTAVAIAVAYDEMDIPIIAAALRSEMIEHVVDHYDYHGLNMFTFDFPKGTYGKMASF